MRVKERILEILRGEIPEELLKLIPSRYPIIGSAVLMRIPFHLQPYRHQIGSAVLSVIPSIKSVWGITDTWRTIRKPKVVYLAGEKNPIVKHRELNTLFKLDISRLTFSPGNREERKKLVKIIGDGEAVLDMFACVGNLSLPIATNSNPKVIYCVEINPYAYRFLLENIVMNKVQGTVIPILKNNLLLNLRDAVDHVLLGFLPCPSLEQIKIAIRSINKEGFLHIHTLAQRNKEQNKSIEIVKIIESLGVRILDYYWEIVKSFSPAFNHIVVRIQIFKGGSG